MGNLLAVVVHAANIHDTKAGIFAAEDPELKLAASIPFSFYAKP